MTRLGLLSFALAAYGMSLLTLLYLVVFLIDPSPAPRSDRQFPSISRSSPCSNCSTT